MPIKEIFKPLKKQLMMPKLYLDDIRNIEKLIQNELKPNSFVITTENYEFTHASELLERIHNPTQITIETVQPNLSIVLAKNNAFMTAEIPQNQQDISTIGVFEKIYKHIIFKRQRVLGYLCLKEIGWILFAPYAALLFLGYAKKLSGLEFLFITGFWYMTYCCLANLRDKHFSIFIPIEQKNENSFISRNKDKIFLLLIGALLGQITWMIDKFLLHPIF